ncbi:MAG: hypothetical protein PHX94_08705 [Bacteroidales bacterium]|jgi:hypothetical protein|nr:hypothetical protein [Bacteroidales bacterium]
MKRIILFSILICTVLQAQAQWNGNTDFNIHGYGRGSVYGGSKAYDLTSVFAELSLQASVKKGPAILESDIRFSTGMFFNEKDTRFRIRELYAGYKSRKVDVFLGNQIVIWGRTDGFNPTNNISPNDYFFLSSDPADQQQSNFMLKMQYRPLPGVDLELVAIPFYKMSSYRFDLFDMGELGNYLLFVDDMLPERILANGTYAVRVNFEYPAFGGSVSWFQGYDPYHGFNVVSVNWASSQPVIRIASVPYRKTAIGADLAVPVGNYMIVRAEASYSHTKNPENKMFIPNPDLSYVVGIETNVLDFIIIGQYIGKFTFDYSPLSVPAPPKDSNPAALIQYTEKYIDYENRLFNRKVFNQQERTNHAVSLTITRSFAYDVLSAECTAYYNFTSKEWLLRPKLNWRISDALMAAVGGHYMKGGEKTLYGYSSAIMNGAFAELKVIF